MPKSIRVSDRMLAALVVSWTVFWAVYIPYRWGWMRAWYFFVAGPRKLVDLSYPHYLAAGGLQLYASFPKLQIGPVAFLIALPLALLPMFVSKLIGCVLMSLAGPAVVWLLADAAHRLRGGSRAGALRAAGWMWVLLAPPWFLLSICWAHLDDVLALLFVAAGVNLLARGRLTLAAVAVGASAAAKPWALAFIPLALAASEQQRIRRLMIAVGVAVGPWLPFVVADPRTLRAASYKIRVIPASVLSLFHVVGGTPSWVRPIQFIGGGLLVALGVRSGRWAAGVVLAIALRLGTDPNVYSYYTTGLLVGAAIWDLLGSRLRVPVLTSTCLLTLYGSTYLRLSEHDHAVLRLATVIAIPIIVICTASRSSESSAFRWATMRRSVDTAG